MAKRSEVARENVARKRSAAILNMLYEYTTPESGMSIDEIIETLRDEYGIEASERAVREHLKALLEMSEAPKADTPHGEARQLDRKVIRIEGEGVKVYWAAEPVFDGAELRLLADGLALSRIDADEMRDTVKKLQRIAGAAGPEIGHLKKLETDERVDRLSLWNIRELSRAIHQRRPVRCKYTHRTASGKLALNRKPGGEPYVHVLDPYQLAFKNGRYYLLCRLHGQAEGAPLSYWRVDHLRDVEVLEDSRTAPASKALPGGARFDVIAHMDERAYPFGGDTVHVRARTTSLDAVFDWFPKAKARETGETEGGRPVYEAEFDTVCEPTRWWALQYAGCVEVLEPPELRAKIADSVKDLRRKYGV